MQIYLPDDLYKLVKSRRLPASELLQNAVRAEVRRLDLLKETDKYIAQLVQEAPPPTPRQKARATALARQIARRTRRKAG